MFAAYAQMFRSQHELTGVGEWHQLEPLFPDLAGKDGLDVGCGYGWHCKYAADYDVKSVRGIDQSELMIAEAMKRNAANCITYCVCRQQDYEFPAAA